MKKNRIEYRIGISLYIVFLSFVSCVKENNPEILEDLLFKEHDASELPEGGDGENESVDYKLYNVIKVTQRQKYIDDDFTTPSSIWSEISSGLFTANINNGHYFLNNNNSHGIIHQASVGDIYSEDFEIEYRLKRNSAKSFNFVGFVWGSSVSPLKFYYITLSDQYGLSVDVGEYDNEKKSWHKSSSLGDYSVESYGYNKFTIRKIKNKYYFFVNEVFFYEADVKPFFGSRIGIYMGNNSKATFDQIKIDKLINL
jgi:hypothetical protein